ncbi:MAG TPA: lanthionine synthetase LanC family protein [Longimicrobium sp.]|nr:lanthionine synthetase LanC family protein [Longimicrobium sp.]
MRSFRGEDGPGLSAAGALEVAAAAGRRLVRDALWWERRCTWTGWTHEVVGGRMLSVHRALGWNLYDGVAGIAVFLARLQRACGDAEIRRHAHGAARQLLAFDSAAGAGEGLYLGRAGVAWALVEVGTVLDFPAARARGVEILCATPSTTGNPDVLSGVAGRVLAALDVFRATGEAPVRALADAEAARLLSLAEPDGHGGRRWLMREINPHAALTGYSHGAAGIALAFGEAAAVLEEGAYLAAAAELLAYERGLFDGAAENWPDLRPVAGDAEDDPAEGPTFEVAWCNGAAGVGLARLALWRRRPERVLVEEVEHAAAATRRHLRSTPELNSSLCHGLCGNLEFLQDAARLLARSALAEGADEASARLADVAMESGFALRSGVMSHQESPVLFLGLAGVGHYFLRLWDPAQVDSLLVIQRDPGEPQRKAAGESADR